MVREAHLFFNQVKCWADNESGPIVRIAPDQVVMEDPDALKTIYGLNSGFTKVMKPKFERVWQWQREQQQQQQRRSEPPLSLTFPSISSPSSMKSLPCLGVRYPPLPFPPSPSY